MKKRKQSLIKHEIIFHLYNYIVLIKLMFLNY